MVMMRKLVRALAWFAAIQIVATIVGQVLSRKMSKGDATSEDFTLAAIMTGKQFKSESADLKTGTVISTMGGVDIDLRDATLDDAGAYLDLTATMGGIRVVVSDEWAVDVDAEAKAGGCEARVTPLDELPEDAPRLNVHAVARMGGVLVTTDA